MRSRHLILLASMLLSSLPSCAPSPAPREETALQQLAREQRDAELRERNAPVVEAAARRLRKPDPAPYTEATWLWPAQRAAAQALIGSARFGLLGGAAPLGGLVYGGGGRGGGAGETGTYTGDKTITGTLAVNGNATLGDGADAHTANGRLTIDGAADAVQFTVKGHSTQTNFLILAESDGGTDQFTVSNVGVVTAAAGFVAQSLSFGVGGANNRVRLSGVNLQVDDGSQVILTLVDDGTTGYFLPTSTKQRGTITLSAGTGTATTFSGATCTCTDTTATNAVQCAVSGTTLTATGTASDVIAYTCF